MLHGRGFLAKILCARSRSGKTAAGAASKVREDVCSAASAPVKPMHVPIGEGRKEPSDAGGEKEEYDEEQRESANRAHGSPAPEGRNEGFPAVFDPLVLPKNGAGKVTEMRFFHPEKEMDAAITAATGATADARRRDSSSGDKRSGKQPGQGPPKKSTKQPGRGPEHLFRRCMNRRVRYRKGRMSKGERRWDRWRKEGKRKEVKLELVESVQGAN